jgi:hypothetical protein
MVMIIDISTYAEAMREEMIAAVFMVIVLNWKRRRRENGFDCMSRLLFVRFLQVLRWCLAWLGRMDSNLLLLQTVQRFRDVTLNLYSLSLATHCAIVSSGQNPQETCGYY